MAKSIGVMLKELCVKFPKSQLIDITKRQAKYAVNTKCITDYHIYISNEDAGKDAGIYKTVKNYDELISVVICLLNGGKLDD